MSMSRRSPIFLWIPVTLLFHVLEEYFFGFPEWAIKHFGPITTRSFFIASHIPIFGIVIYLSLRAYGPKAKSRDIWLALCVQTVLVTNGIFHCITTLLFREYSPIASSGVSKRRYVG